MTFLGFDYRTYWLKSFHQKLNLLPTLKKWIKVLVYYVWLRDMVYQHSGKIFYRLILYIFWDKTEPVGFKSPTFPSSSKSSWFVKNLLEHLSLLCSAQGYPVPEHR